MGDQQRPGVLFDMHESRKWHLAVRRRRGGRQVDHRQAIERTLQRRVDLHDHAILVGLGIDGGNDALPERVIERVVYRGRGDAETGRSGAIDDDVQRQSLLLQVAGDVGDLRQLAELLHQPRHPGVEFGRVRVFKHEMVRSAADRGVDGQVLHRLHVKRDADDAGYFLLYAADDLRRRELSLVVRLEIDQEPPGILRLIGAVDADERTQAFNVRVAEDRLDRAGFAVSPWPRRKCFARPRRFPGSFRYPGPGRSPLGS